MKENTLIEIGRISFVETVYDNGLKELELQWVNNSNYCLYPDEDQEDSVSREQAVELIAALTKHFDLNNEVG